MELTHLGIALLVSFAVITAALVTVIIKFANYKDEKEKNEKALLEATESEMKKTDYYVSQSVKFKEETERLKEHIDELKACIDSDTATHKRTLEKLEYKTNSEASLKRKVEVLTEENKFLIEYGPKILKLNVTNVLYDKLVDGTEIAVPLANKKYWQKQFLDAQGDFKEYHLAEVTNGRREGYQTAKFIINYVELAQKDKSNEDFKFFHVYLGERLN